MKNRLQIALVAAAFAVTACTGSGGGGGGGSSPDSDVVAWVDKVCEVNLGAGKALSNPPEMDVTDPVKLKESFSTWLGTASQAVDKSIKDMEGLKQGPHPDSEKLVTSGLDMLTKFKTALDDSKKTLDEANSADPEAITAAFTKVGTQLTEFATAATKFEEQFKQTNLAEAESKAKNCQELKGGSASATPTS